MVPAVGGGLDVDEDNIHVGDDRVVVRDPEGALVHHLGEQLLQARLVAFDGRFARIEDIYLPARTGGAALDAGNFETVHLGQQGGAGDTHVSHADYGYLGNIRTHVKASG